MADEPSNDKKMMSVDEQKKANEFIIKYLQSTMSDGKSELRGLRRKLSATYWVVILLSVVMFAIGIVLLSIPIFAALRGSISELQSLIAAGFGISDLAALFLFRPIDKVHETMGDMSQISLALDSYQTQVSLRLMEMNGTERPTIGKAADSIKETAKESIKLIQDYFEAKGTTP